MDCEMDFSRLIYEYAEWNLDAHIICERGPMNVWERSLKMIELSSWKQAAKQNSQCQIR